ncbi:MAG TPA: hypothetical protein VHZ07_16620 [Bryobacteraceae bacterium]|jgi:hypothetical protein|nr:hypothetical protein [Bryobacteraceae bacterium]
MAVSPDNSALQVFYGTLPLLGAFLLGIRKKGKRVDDLRDEMRRGFQTVESRLGRLEDRLTELERTARLVRN